MIKMEVIKMHLNYKQRAKNGHEIKIVINYHIIDDYFKANSIKTVLM